MEYVAYIIAFLKVLLQYHPSAIEVSVNGEFTAYNNVWFMTISNVPNTQGLLKIASNANPTDGSMDMTIVHNINRFQFFMMIFFNIVGNRLKEDVIEEWCVNQ